MDKANGLSWATHAYIAVTTSYDDILAGNYEVCIGS